MNILFFEACVAGSFANEELFLHSGLGLIFCMARKGRKQRMGLFHLQMLVTEAILYSS